VRQYAKKYSYVVSTQDYGTLKGIVVVDLSLQARRVHVASCRVPRAESPNYVGHYRPRMETHEYFFGIDGKRNILIVNFRDRI
jgi:hypothetical protein